MLSKNIRFQFFQPVRHLMTSTSENNAVYRFVQEKLNAHQVSYRIIHHHPEGRCDKVSLLRGNALSEAAKSLLLNVKISNAKSLFLLAVLPGDRKVDFTLVTNQFKAKSTSMAPATAVRSLLDCDIGSVPPFSFNPTVKLIVDEALLANKKIYFSPGKLDQSFELNAEDYQKIVSAEGGEIVNITSSKITKLTFQHRGNYE